MTELWLNPAVGTAGDMLLAALLDAGADIDAVRATISSLDVPGWTIETERTTRRGLVALRVVVHTVEHHHHRSWSTIDSMLRTADLPEPVRSGARRTFRRLADAEAHVHGIPIDEVHFHEVGALDAIVDIVGCWAALNDLGMPEVSSAAIGLGTGTTQMAHGLVPVPAPATLELLVGSPTVAVDVTGETATPTGTALITSMVDAERWGPLPAGTIRRTGRGAGTWDPPGHANVMTVVRYEPAHRSASATSPVPDPMADRTGITAPLALPGRTVDAIVLETNTDDVTPEVLGYLIDAALELGADDAWIVPVTMKKNRPGHQVRVLCSPEVVPAVRDLLVHQTATLGWRESPVTKHQLERSQTHVVLDGHAISVKVGPFGAKPEHDDVVAAAHATGRSVRDIAADALAAFRTVES